MTGVLPLASFGLKSRKPSGNGIVEADAALLDQLHRCCGDDRLGHGGEIEDCVLAHRLVSLAIGEARSTVVDQLAVEVHEHDRTQHTLVDNGPVEHGVEPSGKRVGACQRCWSRGNHRDQ